MIAAATKVFTVVFYDDEIHAVIVEQGKQQVIYVPLSPICDFLGLDWDAQRQHVRCDLVLSEVVQGAVIINDPSAGG